MACASAICSVSVASAAPASTRSSSLSASSSMECRVRFQVRSVTPIGRLSSSRRVCRVVAMASDTSKPGVVKAAEDLAEKSGVTGVVKAAEDLVEKIKQSITSAQDVCEGNETSEECVVAWDEVEELSAAAAHKRASTASSNSKDPLEKYCEDNPETDECRVYED